MKQAPKDRIDETSRPRISVCMATCNGERFIAKQLQSILLQLSQDDEVIVSDDSSTDRTLEIIASLNDNRLRLFPNQTFGSPVYNFEHALKQSRGEVIFLSDQDDEWVAGWVETALAALRDASLVVCEAQVIDAEGKTDSSGQARIFHGDRKPGLIRNLYRNGYVGCCTAFRREVLDLALPFPPKLPWHDWWLGLIGETFFSTKFLAEKMLRYRRHGGNFSPTGEKSTSSLRKRFSMRWRIATSLAGRFLKRSLFRGH